MRNILYATLLFIASNGYAVISNSTVWEFRATATSANNSGGFVRGASGTDYTLQDSTHSVHTDLVIDGANTAMITSASHKFTADDIGNLINITAGTGFTTGRYEILSVEASTATLDRSCGTASSTDGTGYIGGALPNFTDALLETFEPGNVGYVKNGSYTITENISVAKVGRTTATITLEGYNASRGDLPAFANRPTITTGTYYFRPGKLWVLDSMNFTGVPAYAGVIGASAGYSQIYFKRLNVINTAALNQSGYAVKSFSEPEIYMVDCDVRSINKYAISGGNGSIYLYGCYIHDSTHGINSEGTFNLCADDTIFDSNTVAVNRCSRWRLSNCTFYGVGSSTAMLTNELVAFSYAKNCIFDNYSTGMQITDGLDCMMHLMNNDFHVTVATTAPCVDMGGNVNLDPQFTDAANDDFTIGTNLKGIGFPSSWEGLSITGYPDIGAVQRQEQEGTPSGGGGTKPNLDISFQ